MRYLQTAIDHDKHAIYESLSYLRVAYISSVHSTASILISACSNDSCSKYASVNVYSDVQCLAESYGEVIEDSPPINCSNN